jgi:hypothetical protein
MVFHTAIQQRFLDRMQEDCRGIGAMITTDSAAREIQIFRSCHPSAIELPRTVAGMPFSVWLDGEGESGR